MPQPAQSLYSATTVPLSQLSDILIDILATLSAAAAGGMRVALPLLAVVLIQQGTPGDRLPLVGVLQSNPAFGALVS
ncbi:MAG: hypothetical protein ACO35Q_09020, partial [Prochlorothrix sp.]